MLSRSKKSGGPSPSAGRPLVVGARWRAASSSWLSQGAKPAARSSSAPRYESILGQDRWCCVEERERCRCRRGRARPARAAAAEGAGRSSASATTVRRFGHPPLLPVAKQTDGRATRSASAATRSRQLPPPPAAALGSGSCSCSWQQSNRPGPSGLACTRNQKTGDGQTLQRRGEKGAHASWDGTQLRGRT